MSRKKAPSRLLTDAVREVRNTRSRFLSLLVLEGEGTVVCAGEAVQAQKGESLFLPAAVF